MGLLAASLFLIGLYYDPKLALFLAGAAAFSVVAKQLMPGSSVPRKVISICLPAVILFYYGAPRLIDRAPDYREFMRWASEGFDADFSTENRLAEIDPELVDVVHLVKAETGENDRILVWGPNPIVYFLSDRQPASKFDWDWPLTIYKPNVTKSERFAKCQDEWRKLYAAEAVANRPKMIIVMQNNNNMVNPVASNAKLKDVPDFSKFLLENYTLRKEYDRYLVYKIAA
jgi:hypothetical protein